MGGNSYGLGGLFGPRRRISTVFNPNAPSPFDDGDYGSGMGPPMTMPQKPMDDQRRGMGGIFGGVGNWLRTRDWEAVGAMLRDDPSYYENLMSRRQQNDLFGMRVRQMKTEEADQQRQQEELNAAIATLPPEMQAWARVAPNAAATRALSPPAAPDWDLDPVTGQPYTITPQGGVQYGQGRVNVRGAGRAAAPAGYEWTEDGGLRAIRGGPADIRAGESAQRMRRYYDTAIRNRENVLDSIEEARQLSNRSGTTGLAGQIFGGVGGTDAHDLQAQVNTIIANIGFEALQEMRANSQTGGALGQVAVRELELLQDTIASLRISQSREQFQANLRRVEAQYNRTLQAYQAARAELEGGGASPAGGEQPRVIELEP